MFTYEDFMREHRNGNATIFRVKGFMTNEYYPHDLKRKIKDTIPKTTFAILRVLGAGDSIWHVYIGIAFQSVLDPYNRKKGNLIAINRCLDLYNNLGMEAGHEKYVSFFHTDENKDTGLINVFTALWNTEHLYHNGCKKFRLMLNKEGFKDFSFMDRKPKEYYDAPKPE